MKLPTEMQAEILLKQYGHLGEIVGTWTIEPSELVTLIEDWIEEASIAAIEHRSVKLCSAWRKRHAPIRVDVDEVEQ